MGWTTIDWCNKAAESQAGYRNAERGVKSREELSGELKDSPDCGKIEEKKYNDRCKFSKMPA